MATNIEATTAGTPVIKRNSGPKQFQALFDVIEVEVTLTEASVAAQVGSQCDITVPGAALGDFVLVSYPADLTGVILSAYVRAANSITVTIYNIEGTDAVTAFSGGLIAKLLVLQPKFGS
jgi:hypothetical protein